MSETFPVKTYLRAYQGSGIPPSSKRFIKTGEFRAPQRGEFFLSGAIPEAYRAFADLSTPYHILKEWS